MPVSGRPALLGGRFCIHRLLWVRHPRRRQL